MMAGMERERRMDEDDPEAVSENTGRMEGPPLAKYVPVRFPADLAVAAAQAAAGEGMTVSAWIRREVQREIDRRGSVCRACGQSISPAVLMGK
jgi:hypothetical protein